MNTLGLVVVENCAARRSEGAYLKRIAEVQSDPYGIPVEISIDETGIGTWGNFKQCMATGTNKGTHRMIMQDDITLDRGTVFKAMHILKHAPDNCFLSIYSPDNSDYRDAYFTGHHILKSPINFWLQCCIYPDAEMPGFIQWAEENVNPDQPGEDCRLSIWMQRNKRTIYAVVPGLVQHLGAFRSTLGTPGVVGKHKRWSKAYDPSLDVFGIDWTEQFKNPYIAQMKSNLARILIK